jgi:hypothetical protein
MSVTRGWSHYNESEDMVFRYLFLPVEKAQDDLSLLLSGSEPIRVRWKWWGG